MSKQMLDIYYVKPGSHMPPKPLRRSRRPVLQGTACDTTPPCRKTAGNKKVGGLYRRYACEVKLESTSQPAGGKDSWPLLPATSVLMSEGHRRQYRRLCCW